MIPILAVNVRRAGFKGLRSKLEEHARLRFGKIQTALQVDTNRDYPPPGEPGGAATEHAIADNLDKAIAREGRSDFNFVMLDHEPHWYVGNTPHSWLGQTRVRGISPYDIQYGRMSASLLLNAMQSRAQLAGIGLYGFPDMPRNRAFGHEDIHQIQKAGSALLGYGNALLSFYARGLTDPKIITERAIVNVEMVREYAKVEPIPVIWARGDQDETNRIQLRAWASMGDDAPARVMVWGNITGSGSAGVIARSLDVIADEMTERGSIGEVV